MRKSGQRNAPPRPDAGPLSPPSWRKHWNKERGKRGTSLNGTVLALLRNALGVPSQAVRSNGLCQLAGAWSEAEYRQFEQAVAPLGEVDEAMWQ